jgi:tight adherence protein C
VSGPALAAGLAGAAAVVAAAELRQTMSRRTGLARYRAVVALVRLGRRLGPLTPPTELAARIEAAGAPRGIRPSDLMAVKMASALLGLGASAPLSTTVPGRLGLLAALALPIAAFLAPDAWLRKRTRERGRQMDHELPDLLDLLRVAIAAGLPLSRALAEIARLGRGPLASELRTLARRLELGIPLEQALTQLDRRSPSTAVTTLTTALGRAAKHGAPLTDTLYAQAQEARATRARHIREQADRAAPKIQLVIALLLVPAVLLLVAAVLLTTLQH